MTESTNRAAGKSGGRPLPGAPLSDGGGAPIVAFQPRRTYADAQRDAGIVPLADQLAQAKAKLAALEAEQAAKARRLDELLGEFSDDDRQRAAARAEKQRARTAEKAVAFDAIAAEHGDEIGRVRAAIIARHRAFLEQFAAAGLGARHVPALIALMFETDADARDAPAIFAAFRPEPATGDQTAIDYEASRECSLNAAGLIQPRPRPRRKPEET